MPVTVSAEPTSVRVPSQRDASTGRRIWLWISSAGAALLGLLPHVLHHVGLFAGALFAGVGGSLIFGALGFLAAIPFLLRMHRRTGNWRAPGAVLALFAVIFSISTFVIGPAINGSGDSKSSSTPAQPSQPATPGPAKKDAHGH